MPNATGQQEEKSALKPLLRRAPRSEMVKMQKDPQVKAGECLDPSTELPGSLKVFLDIVEDACRGSNATCITNFMCRQSITCATWRAMKCASGVSICCEALDDSTTDKATGAKDITNAMAEKSGRTATGTKPKPKGTNAIGSVLAMILLQSEAEGSSSHAPETAAAESKMRTPSLLEATAIQNVSGAGGAK